MAAQPCMESTQVHPHGKRNNIPNATMYSMHLSKELQWFAYVKMCCTEMMLSADHRSLDLTESSGSPRQSCSHTVAPVTIVAKITNFFMI